MSLATTDGLEDLDRVAEAWIGLEMADVVDRTPRQVVEDLHAGTAHQQLFGEMRADEGCHHRL